MSVLEWVKVIFWSGEIEQHRHLDGETVSVITIHGLITSCPNIAKESGCCLLYTNKFKMPFKDRYLAVKFVNFSILKKWSPTLMSV